MVLSLLKKPGNYDACNTIVGDSDKRIAISGMIEDLENSGITHEKYRDFVSEWCPKLFNITKYF